ncbi:LicD family protein [Adlercreutzia muris]|uniref:LicD family protein n=1 Tax=Adlercreutzia muris TaxID=1796610 RepID=UPI001F583127|nr:LicD family protein [Adlercreutzia muris]
MEPLTSDEMKQIELDIMSEIDRICREHNLRYFLAYGTLLGAVRHDGFIPWDDDMDIVMPRDDYETLLAHFDEWKQAEHIEVSSYRKGNSIHPFTKIVDSTTLVSERFLKPEYKTGVWVDIFPLDHVPANKKKVFRRKSQLSFFRALSISDPSDGVTPLARFAKRVLVPLSGRINPIKLARKTDENARFCEKSDEKAFMVVASSAANPLMVFPEAWFDPIEMNFENRSFLAPAGWREFLELVYGDWKSLPPENERPQHVTEAYRLV